MITHRYADVDDSSGRRSRIRTGCAALSALVAALGAGIAIGHATRGTPPPAIAPAQRLAGGPVSSSSPSGPTRVVAGVPAGFADTPGGAVHAAVAFLGVEVSDLMAHPDAYLAAWRQMCTSAYFDSTGRAAAETLLTAEQTDNHLISNAAAGQRVYEQAFPLSVVIAAYADATATVRTWSLIVAHPGDGPTVVAFSGGTLQLHWWHGDWKLDGGSASSSASDGASGPLLLDAGPQFPAYLGAASAGGEASPHG